MLDMLFFSGKFWAAAAPAANPTIQTSSKEQGITASCNALLRLASPIGRISQLVYDG